MSVSGHQYMNIKLNNVRHFKFKCFEIDQIIQSQYVPLHVLAQHLRARNGESMV